MEEEIHLITVTIVEVCLDRFLGQRQIQILKAHRFKIVMHQEDQALHRLVMDEEQPLTD